MSSPLCLIGFMGAGKSTVGQLVAKQLGRVAVDLDEVIVRDSGLASIADIFIEKGEKVFRELESAALVGQVASSESIVIMTGGGVIESEANRAILKQVVSSGGGVVYLQTDFSTISERLKHDLSRPLFQDPVVALQRFTNRTALYEEVASLVVNTEGKSPQQVADEVVKEHRDASHG